MSYWSEEEIEKLCRFYPNTTKDEIGKMFPNRTALSIYKKAYKLCLRRKEKFAYKTDCEARAKIPYKRDKEKTSQGYILVYSPENHRANNKGRVLEHILVWETFYNREVPNGYVVHHINGIKVITELKTSV